MGKLLISKIIFLGIYLIINSAYAESYLFNRTRESVGLSGEVKTHVTLCKGWGKETASDFLEVAESNLYSSDGRLLARGEPIHIQVHSFMIPKEISQE